MLHLTFRGMSGGTARCVHCGQSVQCICRCDEPIEFGADKLRCESLMAYNESLREARPRLAAGNFQTSRVFAGTPFEMFFFFFQAEDGIRDYKVTGVQTCALPI